MLLYLMLAGKVILAIYAGTLRDRLFLIAEARIAQYFFSHYFNIVGKGRRKPVQDIVCAHDDDIVAFFI